MNTNNQQENSKCRGVHCRCMDIGGNCPNMHWYHCMEHNPEAYQKGGTRPDKVSPIACDIQSPHATPLSQKIEEETKKLGNKFAFQLNPSNDTMEATRLFRKMLPEALHSIAKEAQREERVRSALIVEELMEDSEAWQPIAGRILGRTIIRKEDIIKE